jgi:hypothetical protein
MGLVPAAYGLKKEVTVYGGKNPYSSQCGRAVRNTIGDAV